MIKETTNIDRLFHNGLANHETEVPSFIWDNITTSLNEQKRHRKIVYFRRMAAVAAIFLAFFAGYWITLKTINNQYNANNNFPVATKINSEQNNGSGETIKLFDLQRNNSRIAVSSNNESQENTENKDALSGNSNQQNRFVGSTQTNNNQTVSNYQNAIASNEISTNSQNVNNQIVTQKINFDNILAPETNLVLTQYITDSWEAFALNNHSQRARKTEMYLNALNNQPIQKEDHTNNNWAVSGVASPLYSFRNPIFNESPELPTEYYQKMESPLLSYSGGLTVEYSPLNRLSIQSGVFYSQIGQQASEFVAINNKGEGIHVSTTAGNIEGSLLQRPRNISPEGAPVPPPGGLVQYDWNLIQQFDYVEIPLVARYKLIDKKITMNIIGGFTTNILVGNKVYIDEVTDLNYLGTTMNMRPMNYNGTIGIGAEFSLTKHISLNFEPAMRYSITPANSKSETLYYPYSFAIFSGLKYSF